MSSRSPDASISRAGALRDSAPVERVGADQPRRRRFLRGLAAAGGLVLVVILFRIVGWPSIAANLARVGGWFPLLVVLYAAAQLAFTLGWANVFEPRSRASQLPNLFAVYLAGDAANSVLPGNVAGEPLKVQLLKSEEGTGRALASITIHKHADMLAQWLFVAAGVAVALARFPLPFAARAAAVVGVAALGALLLLLTWALKRGTYSPVLRRLARWKPLAAPLERLHAPAATVDARIRSFYGRRPARFAIATAWCFLGWCGGLLETYLVLRLLAPGAGWSAAIAIEALAMALNNMLLWIPGRIGGAEGVRVGVFVLLGLTGAQGAAYALLRRGRELAWTLPGVLVLIQRHALGRLERRRSEPEAPGRRSPRA